jgi:hypothetical protein
VPEKSAALYTDRLSQAENGFGGMEVVWSRKGPS